MSPSKYALKAACRVPVGVKVKASPAIAATWIIERRRAVMYASLGTTNTATARTRSRTANARRPFAWLGATARSHLSLATIHAPTRLETRRIGVRTDCVILRECPEDPFSLVLKTYSPFPIIND